MRASYALPARLRIHRLPEAIPRALGSLLFVTAFLKGLSMRRGCEQLEIVNALMFPVECVIGLMLLHPAMGRRRAALFWAILMPFAALYLLLLGAAGYDAKECTCFGPVRLALPTHLVVLAAHFVAAALIFLREETRPPARDEIPFSRLRQIFR